MSGLNKNMRFVVTWTAEGKRCEKVYTDYAQAQRAQKWLLARGVEDVDLAVRLPKPADEDKE
jgi:hypothetical protein